MSRLTDARTRAWLRITLLAAVAGMVGYFSALAAYPNLRAKLPSALSWFGAPGSEASIVIACAAICLACTVAWRSGFGRRSVGGPIGITLVLTVISAVLGFSSYAWCHDDQHPALITPLLWTGGLIRGATDDHRLGAATQPCPTDVPVALDVARVSTLAAILIGIFGIVAALLQSRLDRLRVRFDNSITAVIAADEQADSMVDMVANTLERNSRLVIITTFADAQRRSELRHAGHRIVVMDPEKPDALQSVPIWPRVTRVYLLSPDPATNLKHLQSVNRCLLADRNRRLPLTIRIDDPWQAEAWRAQQLGGSDRRWVADAIGKYEVTAHRLLDSLVDDEHVTSIIVCGTTPLTLAICANLVRRRLERDFYTEPSDPPLPSLTVVGESAEEYRRDEEFHLAQRGIAPAGDWLQAVPQRPSLSALTSLLTRGRDGQAPEAAVVITEAPCDPLLATLLAAHYPSIPIYAYSPDAPLLSETAPILGRLHTFRLSMDLPPGHSLDVWERAAMLIHNRYAAKFRGSSAAAKPWSELDEFYRGSNRRQVRNALWMVDQIAGHTWDTFGSPPSPKPVPSASNRLRSSDFRSWVSTGPPLWRWPGQSMRTGAATTVAPAGATVHNATTPRSATTGSSAGRASKPIPPRSTAPSAAWLPPCGRCASWDFAPVRSGNSSVAPAPSRPSNAAGRGLGHRCPASRCAPRRVTGRCGARAETVGRFGTTSSAQPMSTSTETSGAVAVWSKPGRHAATR